MAEFGRVESFEFHYLFDLIHPVCVLEFILVVSRGIGLGGVCSIGVDI